MKIGKVPESVLKRSVLKQIKVHRPEVILGASVGEDCAAIRVDDGDVMVLSTDPITGTAEDIGKLAVHVTANDLASSGAQPIGVMVTILLPDDTEEAVLRSIMVQIQEHCEEMNMQVLGGHTEVTNVVSQPLVSITGVGKARADRLISTAGIKPGMDIVMTKWIGLEGTSILAKDRQQELLARYPQKMIDTAKEFDRYLSVVKEGMIGAEYGVASMHDVTEGGIFGALWEIAEASDVGLEIDLMAIPVRQETIEVCEFFDINPYQLISSGSMLMATTDGNGLVAELKKHDVQAAVIGKATKGNDRVLLHGEERRFLEPPKTDELYNVL